MAGSETKKRRLDENDDFNPDKCMKLFENAHEKLVAERKEPATWVSSRSGGLLKIAANGPNVAPEFPFAVRRPALPISDVPAIFSTSGAVSSSGGISSSPADALLDMRTRPICRHPSGSVWAGVSTAIVGDSMLRGKEIKKYFGSWAQVFMHEDVEALAQKPPGTFDRVFYVSAGNALYRHPIMFQEPAFKNIRSEAFLNKCGGVILLGSVELWDKLYAPTRPSGKTVNPSFFDDVTLLLTELDVPVIHLDNEFINNLPYTADVHLGAGKSRVDLAKHIEDHLVEMSQSAADEKGGVDESWMNKFRDACAPKKAAAKNAGWKPPGCKWCQLGECWDHQEWSGTGNGCMQS